MKPIIYKYKNFSITINDNAGDIYIKVRCTLDAQTVERIYDIKHNITSVVMDEEYVYLNFQKEVYSGKVYLTDSQYVIKVEGTSGLVIDIFDNLGNHLEVIGCHDFWDDISFF